MRTSIFTTIRFVLALLTLLAIVAKPYIPPKTLPIYPSPATTPSIYSITDDGEPAVRWTDRSRAAWRCEYLPKRGVENCGMAITWEPDGGEDQGHSPCTPAAVDPDGDGWGWENERTCRVPADTVLDPPQSDEVAEPPPHRDVSHGTRHVPACTAAAIDPDGDGWGWENERSCHFAEVGEDEAVRAVQRNQPDMMPSSTLPSMDFSHYDGLRVKLHYEGRANYLRLYLRDKDPSSTLTGQQAEKFMSAYLRTEDLKAGHAFISLSEFTVPEWWILSNNAPRSQAVPTFEHVVTVGVGHVDPGVHKMRVEHIELVGERIPTEGFLMGILVLWALYLCGEASIRYYDLRRSSRQHEVQIDALASQAEILEQEKSTLKNRSITDPLTGVMNRNGLLQQLRAQHGGETLPAGAGVIVLDIDHFKRINDTLGHDSGDEMLREIAQLVKQHIRSNDFFTRWGGEEFVLITPPASAESLTRFAEKLRTLVSDRNGSRQLELPVTISIGLTRAHPNEAFDAAFSRADLALYNAKRNRNSVIYRQ